jgi:hypothetical protein
VSSGEDGRVSRERRALQDAKEAAGLLRLLERACNGPAKPLGSTFEPFRDGLGDILQSAARLLGPNDRMSSTIKYLQLEFDTADEISFDLVQENISLISLVAGALELRFNLQPGGGYGGQGGYGFSITQFPQDEYPKII